MSCEFVEDDEDEDDEDEEDDEEDDEEEEVGDDEDDEDEDDDAWDDDSTTGGVDCLVPSSTTTSVDCLVSPACLATATGGSAAIVAKGVENDTIFFDEVSDGVDLPLTDGDGFELTVEEEDEDVA